MGLRELFKSGAEREKDMRSRRRKAMRAANSAINTVRQHADKARRERDQAWSDARDAMAGGSPAGAKRYLAIHRAASLRLAAIERKRHVSEGLVTRLDLAGNDSEFASVLSTLDQVIEVDPEAVAAAVDSAQDVIGEAEGADQVWNQLWDDEMMRADDPLSNVSSLDELERQLAQDVAIERDTSPGTLVYDDGRLGSGGGGGGGAMSERIEQGRDRLRKLLEE